REAYRNRPFEAIWRFNLSMDDLNAMASKSLRDLKRQSDKSALRLCILPGKTSGSVSPRVHGMLYSAKVSTAH
ncbi:MAG: hypothetical protein ACOYMG_17080, partial [Candidatus Methylumidiphilus sp.]